MTGYAKPRPTTPIVDRYLAWCRQRNLSATYVHTIRQTLTRMERALDIDLVTATEDDVKRWYGTLTLEIKPEAYGIYLVHVAGFYGWLVRERIRVDDPTIRLPRPRVKRRLPRPIGDEALARAIGGAHGRVRVWLILAAFAGLRACEVAGLDIGDFRFDSDPPVLVVRHAKGGKDRIVPMSPVVVDALVAFGLPMSGPAFSGKAGNVHVMANTVSQNATRYLHSVGITDTFHSLRHWFGTSIYRASLDLRLCQELLGHSDPKTTALYAAFSPVRAAPVVASLHLPTHPDIPPETPIHSKANTLEEPVMTTAVSLRALAERLASERPEGDLPVEWESIQLWKDAAQQMLMDAAGGDVDLLREASAISSAVEVGTSRATQAEELLADAVHGVERRALPLDVLARELARICAAGQYVRPRSNYDHAEVIDRTREVLPLEHRRLVADHADVVSLEDARDVLEHFETWATA